MRIEILSQISNKNMKITPTPNFRFVATYFYCGLSWMGNRPRINTRGLSRKMRVFNTLVPLGEKLKRFTVHPLENVSLISWPISLPQ